MNTINEVTEKTEDALLAFFSANTCLSLLTSALLQQLWSMVNALQIAMLTTLFVIHLPKNADMIMVMILRLVSFDFFKTETIMNSIFYFRETNQFMTVVFENGEEFSVFAEAGYDSSNFWLMLGPLFMIIIITAIAAALKRLCELVLRRSQA